MSSQPFLKWLERVLSEKGRTPVPTEGISPRETVLAERIKRECEQAAALQRYSKLSLQALNNTEMLCEMTLRVLSSLIKIGRTGEGPRDIDELCSDIVGVLSQDLEFENCSIMLKEPGGGHLRIVAGKGKGDKYLVAQKRRGKRARSIRIGEGIAGRVAESGEYLFVPDVSKNRHFKPLPMEVHVASLLSMPLRNNEGVIGVVNFSHSVPDAFDTTRIHLVMLLSDYVGQMITLATLYNRTTDWNETLRREVAEKTKELVAKNRKLHKIAVTDSLTGLYNRRFFFMRLEQEFSRALRYGEHFALLIIDLDNLKPINDTYGHITGDRVIKGLGKFLGRAGRKGDTIGRIGGDEFAYILLNADETIAHSFALRLQEEFASMDFRGVGMRTTISVGIACTQNYHFDKYQALYRAADDALYRAKKKRNSVSIFRPSLRHS
ncbi:MAG: sensor domain-containing diguanylate cyclase [Alphaproteobacteria bacterium]|uniref:diguanylate cyclase n=1 Tax=Candidatus Nitrobium versatile TaxID=2884831 RepID=A0A953JCL7_9BACT|nr:sensor domain-containing diguanylate cyclase [Candidatus Nitrobium versatile]